jgi:sarcosine oxidase subunit gamma
MKLSADDPWVDVPGRVGALALRPVDLGPVTEVLGLPGRDLDAGLRAAVGIGDPGPGRSDRRDGIRVLWSGLDAVLVVGARVRVDGALCVDQGDAWAALMLSGDVRSVLARLCPLDLREAAFPVGATARSLLGHVGMILSRLPGEDWLLLVPRPMTSTVAHDLVEASEGLAARRRTAGQGRGGAG